MYADVTVIIPHYNALGTISRSIESIISQTLSVREIIVVDDASADFNKLSELLLRYSGLIDIRLIRSTNNCGAGHARNEGVRLATTKYVAFLDSDDVWHPEKIARQVAFMQAHDLSLSGHGYLCDLNAAGFSASPVDGHRTISKLRFVYGNPIFTPTVMVVRATFKPFDERYRRMEDYKCWFENHAPGRCAALTAGLAGGYKQPLGASGLSSSARLMHQDYVRVLGSLLAQRKMNIGHFFLAIAIEYLKYPIRLCRVALKNS